MDTELSGSASKSFSLNVWEKHEKIAMHFNDLILKVRIQALGAITAVVTVGSVLLKTVQPETHFPWGLLTSVFAVLFLFWIAIWMLDFLYYNRLLSGAVDSLLELENAINSGNEIKFNMSHRIEDAVLGKQLTHIAKSTYWGPRFFYLIVTVVLFSGMAYSCARFLCSLS
jgi:hypothetical protein